MAVTKPFMLFRENPSATKMTHKPGIPDAQPLEGFKVRDTCSIPGGTAGSTVAVTA